MRIEKNEGKGIPINNLLKKNKAPLKKLIK